METAIKFVLILFLAPLLLCLALQLVLGVFTAVLPWLIGLAMIAGAVTGVTAGFVLLAFRRRFEPDRPLPPAPAFHGEPIRRPRGPRQED